MPRPIVALKDDLPFLRKLVCRQAKENALLLRAFDNERILTARAEERLQRMVYVRSKIEPAPRSRPGTPIPT